jgi:hypothetical protein
MIGVCSEALEVLHVDLFAVHMALPWSFTQGWISSCCYRHDVPPGLLQSRSLTTTL